MDDLIRDSWQVLGLGLIWSIVVMALLQLSNDLLPIRRAYQRGRVLSWIEDRIVQFRETKRKSPPSSAPSGDGAAGSLPDVNGDEAMALLIANATGGHSRALFALPTPQLVAQMNAAAQMALDEPVQCFSFLAVVSQPVQPTLFRHPGVAQAAAGLKAAHLDDLMTVLRYHELDPEAKKSQTETGRYLEARNRIVHRIQRNLDSIQITLGYAGTMTNQAFAVAISLALAAAIVLNEPKDAWQRILFNLLVTLCAGALGPVLGDIFTWLRRGTRA